MSIKRNIIKVLGTVCVLTVLTAQAGLIEGGILFHNGTFNVDNLPPNAKSVSDLSGFKVLSQFGSYASVPTDTAVTWSDFTFDPFSAVNPLWHFEIVTVNGTVKYSFAATSIIVIEQSEGFLNLMGSGVAHIDGFTDTTGNWNLVGLGGDKTSFVFGANGGSSVPNGGTAVPDGGSAVILLGMALSGLGLLGRKMIS